MASVSSLDQDMRRLRLDRYTPQAANEVRSWIEDTLEEQLPAGDILECLKDGVALCKLANLVLPPPGVKYKSSSMPFVQRENISHFLTACERPPLNLPAHDRFLTVDLYDNKDPTQVMQCLSAFSRAANSINPSQFPRVIGPKKAGIMSPTRKTANGGLLGEGYTRNTGASNASQDSDAATARALSPALTGGSSSSRATGLSAKGSVSTVSSWSKKSDEGTTAPAWNIHQYGYMGGASQGNQGVSFGARRQIASTSPMVPSIAEKEQRRKEREIEEERLRAEALEEDHRRRAQREAEEEEQRAAEEEAWQEQTRKAREKEREELEREQRKWEEEERQWKEEEERRKAEEQRVVQDVSSPSRPGMQDKSRRVTETERIRELERQLEEAKERERQYQLERTGRGPAANESEPEPQPSSTLKLTRYETSKQGQEEEPMDEKEVPADEKEGLAGENEEPVDEREEHVNEKEESVDEKDEPVDEREALQSEWQKHQDEPVPSAKPIPPPKILRPPEETPTKTLPQPSKPKPTVFAPRLRTPPPPASPKAGPPSPLPRPLPDPTPYFSTATASNRTDRFLARNPPPVAPKPKSYYPSEIGMTSTSEGAAEDARRIGGQTKTKAGGWASKSLLEREMEKERERQKEWEEAQMQRPGGARSGGLLGPRELKR